MPVVQPSASSASAKKSTSSSEAPRAKSPKPLREIDKESEPSIVKVPAKRRRRRGKSSRGKPSSGKPFDVKVETGSSGKSACDEPVKGKSTEGNIDASNAGKPVEGKIVLSVSGKPSKRKRSRRKYFRRKAALVSARDPSHGEVALEKLSNGKHVECKDFGLAGEPFNGKSVAVELSKGDDVPTVEPASDVVPIVAGESFEDKLEPSTSGGSFEDKIVPNTSEEVLDGKCVAVELSEGEDIPTGEPASDSVVPDVAGESFEDKIVSLTSEEVLDGKSVAVELSEGDDVLTGEPASDAVVPVVAGESFEDTIVSSTSEEVLDGNSVAVELSEGDDVLTGEPASDSVVPIVAGESFEDKLETSAAAGSFEDKIVSITHSEFLDGDFAAESSEGDDISAGEPVEDNLASGTSEESLDGEFDAESSKRDSIPAGQPVEDNIVHTMVGESFKDAPSDVELSGGKVDASYAAVPFCGEQGSRSDSTHNGAFETHLSIRRTILWNGSAYKSSEGIISTPGTVSKVTLLKATKSFDMCPEIGKVVHKKVEPQMKPCFVPVASASSSDSFEDVYLSFDYWKLKAALDLADERKISEVAAGDIISSETCVGTQPIEAGEVKDWCLEVATATESPTFVDIKSVPLSVQASLVPTVIEISPITQVQIRECLSTLSPGGSTSPRMTEPSGSPSIFDNYYSSPYSKASSAIPVMRFSKITNQYIDLESMQFTSCAESPFGKPKRNGNAASLSSESATFEHSAARYSFAARASSLRAIFNRDADHQAPQSLVIGSETLVSSKVECQSSEFIHCDGNSPLSISGNKTEFSLSTEQEAKSPSYSLDSLVDTEHASSRKNPFGQRIKSKVQRWRERLGQRWVNLKTNIKGPSEKA